MKLSHRRQVPSESFVTMCPGLLGKVPCEAMVRNVSVVVLVPEDCGSIGFRKARNARGPHTLVKLSHRRQVPSGSFVAMCPGRLTRCPWKAAARVAAVQRKRILLRSRRMTGQSPRPYTKGWLPGGILPEEARTTSSATTPYSPRSSIELFGCELVSRFTSSSRQQLAIWLLPIG